MARRPSADTPDLLVAARASLNEGVVDHRELIASGLTRDQIAKRLASGRLHQLYRGVYAVGHRSLTRRGRWIAALRAAGPEAVLCSFSGGRLRGLSVHDDGVAHVCVPPSGRRDQRGLRIHAARLRREERGWFCGLPVTSLSRLLLELSGQVGERRLGKLMAEAIDLGMSPDGLESQLSRSRGCRGVRALRAAADGYVVEQPTRSPPEARFLMICGRAGIPAPVANVPVGDREVDFLWPDLGLIVEIDGFGPHRDRERFEGDRERAVELRLAGYEYLPFTPRQVDQRPQWVAQCVQRARHNLLQSRRRGPTLSEQVR